MCSEQAIRVNYLVTDRRSEGVCIASALMSTEREDLITPFLQVLMNLEPDACRSVVVHISDGNKAFQNAWLAVVGTNPKFVFCSWHLERAWKENIKTEYVLRTVLRLRTEGKLRIFANTMHEIQENWRNPQFLEALFPGDQNLHRTIMSRADYFFRNYGDGSR